MSKGGSIAEQIKQTDAAIDRLAEEFVKAQIPGPKQIYRMQDDEFMHHIHVLALTNILKERLGITAEQIDLELRKVFLEEGKRLLEMAKAERSRFLRDQITKSAKPNIILPDNPQI